MADYELNSYGCCCRCTPAMIRQTLMFCWLHANLFLAQCVCICVFLCMYVWVCVSAWVNVCVGCVKRTIFSEWTLRFLTTKDLPHTHKPTRTMCYFHRKKFDSCSLGKIEKKPTWGFVALLCPVGRVLTMMYGYKMHIAINLMFTLVLHSCLCVCSSHLWLISLDDPVVGRKHFLLSTSDPLLLIKVI